MTQSEDKTPDPFSKSRQKREAEHLQKMGQTLIALSASQLARMPLPDALLAAIQFAHTLKSHEAKRRHLQYIGKLMRDVDAAPIELALSKLKAVHRQKTEEFHLVEEWRERLIKEGDLAVQAFIADYPQVDRQQLRQLVRKAQHDRANEKNTGAEKALFTYLRELMG